MIDLSAVKPVGKKVLVSVIVKEVEELKSSLILLDINDEPQLTDRCKVLRIGTTVELVEENKTYVYAIGRGVQLTYKGNEYLLLDEKDFYAEVDQ